MNRREDEPCCGMALLKYSLFIYTTLIYMLCSVCVLAFCVYIYVMHMDYAWALASRVYPAVVVALAVGGLLGLAVALLACVGSLAESKRFLLLFIVPVAIVFVLELGCAIVAAVYSSNVQSITADTLGPMIHSQYGVDEDFTTSVDALQQQERCCGGTSFSEYATSKGSWLSDGEGGTQVEAVPESCCRSRTPQCGRRTHPSNIFTYGCAEPLGVHTKRVTMMVAVVSIAAAALQLIGMVLACWLYARINDREQIKRRRPNADYYYDS